MPGSDICNGNWSHKKTINLIKGSAPPQGSVYVLKIQYFILEALMLSFYF